MTSARKINRAKLLAAARKAALSVAQRGSPSTRARRAPSRLMQAAFDKSSRRNTGQIRRASINIPRGLSRRHHFNAFGPQRPQALAFSVGPATHITGARRTPLKTESSDSFSLVVFQPGSGYYQLQYLKRGANGTWSQGLIESIVSTGIVPSTTSASSPDTIMCSRGSIRIRNITPAANVAGAVHVLRTSSGFPNFWNTPTAGVTESVKDYVLEHRDTVSMSGSQLTGTHQWDCIPVSQDKYHAFVAPDENLSMQTDPGLSNIFFLIEHDSTQNQTYEFSFAASYYARYRVIGPLANSAESPPVIPLGMINHVRDLAESIGSLGTPLIKSVMNAAVDGAQQSLPGFLGNLVRQNLPLALTAA